MNTEQPTPEIAGYILARYEGPGVGALVPDWDGKVHADLDGARAELHAANGYDDDSDPDWAYSVYALTEVPAAVSPVADRACKAETVIVGKQLVCARSSHHLGFHRTEHGNEWLPVADKEADDAR